MMDHIAIVIFSVIFLVLAIIDLRTKIIPNIIIYPSIILALVISSFTTKGLLNSTIGGVVGFTIVLVPALVSNGGIGFGDVKLAGLIGIVTGFGEVLIAIALAFILGGLIAIILMATNTKRHDIPMGPYLSIGAIVSMIWGTRIIDIYLREVRT
jgi:prepilin signal peptidase PulO-like enzyme (type II secretory pathway)